jgi:MFS family permease
MEAIILYIKLVRVFGQENKWQYIIFTILSYGLPFAYLFISVPVGFGRRKEWSYGVDNARVNQTDLHSCWLTVSDHFIFAFIVPVLLIILVNCFIFVVVMAIITKKLQQSHENVKVKKIRTWLRSAASLIVILGIGWVVGIFMFHPVMYYVAVIYYGFQGVFIFVLFVLLSSKVRSTIWKKWRTFAQNHSTSSDLNSSRQGKRSIISLLLFRSSGKLSKSSNSKSNSGEKEHPGKTHNGIELGTFGGRLHKPCGSEVDDADKLTKSIVAEEDNNLYDKIENDKESKPNDDEKSCESTFQDKETGHDSCVMHFD